VNNPLDYLFAAVAWVIDQIHNGLTPIFGASSGWTWALTIIIIVVLMRMVMVPLFIKQMHTTRKMTSLQPQISALRKKYKNDKQTLNQEMMRLYQEAGVNPLMGCLPILAQLPLFYALFYVLRAIAEWTPGKTPAYDMPHELVASAKHAAILGASIADKVLFTPAGVHVPLHAKVVIVCAVLISMTTTFLSVRQSMKRGMMPTATPDNPMGQSQKYMMYIMPLFALTGLYWPFGLVLYWVTTNVWTLGQQWILFKRYPYTPPAAATAGTAVAGGAAATALAGPGGAGRSGRSTMGAGRAAGGRTQGRPPRGQGPGRSGAGAGGSANGASPPGSASPNGGGMLRRMTKGRAEPEPEIVQPEVKVVRQQRQRQSRSKRSGKR
jgi:YidC/Oxa1 family membrane protein insertase